VTERTVVTRLRADISDLKSKMLQAQQAVTQAAKGMGESLDKNGASIDRLATKAGIAGLALTAAAGVAVKKWADFDQQMSAVQAATSATTGQMDALQTAAIDAGKRTVYSAAQSAGAIEELAKAGVEVTDILNGGLDGALDLAAAGSIDVADAASIAATAMTQFRLEGNKVSHVADLLAAGANKAQGGVADMGMALKQSGLVASQVGISLEETVGTLTAFAKAGLIGSDAGTSFRTMLLHLANPTKEARQRMDELGISAYDISTGAFVGMSNLAGQLQDRLGGLTQAERDQTLALLFGMDAIRGANVLYQQGADGIASWTKAVDENGYAQEVAATRLDNLKGDLEQLSGSVETAAIKMGATADGPLRKLTQEATNVVNAFADAPGAVQGVTLSIVGGGGLVLLGVAGLGKLAVSLNEIKTLLATLKISGKTAGLAVAGVGTALAVGGIALMQWAQDAAEARARTEEFKSTLDELGRTTPNTLSAINDELSKPVGSWFYDLFGQNYGSAIDEAQKLGLTIKDLQGYVLGEADAVARVTQVYEDARATRAGFSAEDAAAASVLKGALDRQASSLSKAEKEAGQKAEADREAGIAAQDTAAFTQQATDAIDRNTNALSDNIDAQSKAAGVVLNLWDAQTNLEDAYAKANASLKENGERLDATSEKGRANRDALSQVAQAGWDVIDSMTANGATLTELRGTMQDTRDRFVALAESMGMSKADANALADELRLIPTDITTDVKVNDRASSVLDSIWTKIKRLPGGIVVTTDVATGSSSYRRGDNMAAYGEGGAVRGPGTATSDSINARLSNGEYVIRAAAHAQYGTRFFDQLNAQRFASGGSVGAASFVGPTSAGIGAAVAAALDGMHMTLVTEAGPIRAIARAEAGAALGDVARIKRAGVR